MKSKLPSKPASRKPEGNKNQLFHLLFENNPLPMWVYDLETLFFLEVNEAAVEHYGYSRNEFLKLRITDILPSEEARFVEKHAKAKRPRLQHSGEWRHCKKDGSIIHVELTAHKLTYDGHKAALVSVNDITGNITESKRFEETARAIETSYRSLFNSVTEAIYIQDRKGRFLDVNAGAAKMYGYSREFLIGKTPEAISAPGRNDLKKVQHAIRLAFEGHPQEFEFWGLRSNGEVFPKNVRLYKGIYLDQDVLIALAQDITERKQSEDAIAASETKYRALVEQLPTVVYINPADDPTVTIFISPQIESLLGYTQAEWLADPKLWEKSLHPEDRERVLAESKRMTASGESTNVEYRIIARDGRLVWVRDETVLVHDAEGKPEFWQGVMMDVTDSKQAEEALRQSEERFRNLFENSSIGIYRTAPDGRILLSNPAIVHMLGYDSFEELVQRNLEKDGNNAGYPRSQFRAMMERDGEVRGLEAEWRKKDGASIFVRESARLIRDHDGQPLYYDGTVEDITEKKQAEESRRATEAKYRALVENVSAIFYLDAVDDLSSTIYISPQVETLLGYKPEEWTTRSNFWQTVIHPDDYAAWQAESIRTNKTGEPFKMEYRLVARNGHIVWTNDEAVLIRDDAGQPLYWQGVHFDITNRKRAEEELAASEAELSAIFASMPDVVLALDKDGRYLKIAPTDPRLLHLPAEMMLGKLMHEVFSRQKADELVGHIREALDKKQTIQFEYALLLGDHIAWFSGTTSPLTEDSVVWVGRDITAHKLAEDTLQQRIKELSLIYETSQHLQQILTPEMLVDELIRLLKKMLDYEHAAVLLVDEPSGKLIPFAVSDQGQWFTSIQEYKDYVTSHELGFGNGITGWVAQHGQSICLGDVRNDSRYVPTSEDARSELCVPLMVGNSVIGVVNVESARMYAYAESDQRLMETVAAQIAIAIQNARLFEAEHLRRQEAEMLRQAANALASSLELEDVLNELLDSLALVVPFNSATVFIKENADFRAIATRGFDPLEQIKGQILPGTNELARIVEETRRPLILPDAKADSRFANWGPIEKIRGWMAIPLILRNQYVGFLTIDSHHPNAFTEANAEMALAFASHAAAAIQNARLYEEAVRRMAELEALYESGLALGKSLDPREISEKVVSVLAERLNWHHAAVRVRRDNSDDIELLAFSQVDSEGHRERVDTSRLMPGRTILRVGQGMAGWVIEHGRAINSSDLKNDPRYYQTFAGMQSGLYVPIWAGERVLGCISVETQRPNAFTESDERLLTTLAAQAASAMENARLFAAEQSRRQDAETLQRAAAALSSSLDPQQIIDKLLDELSRVISFRSSTVFIEEKKGARAISGRGLAHPEKVIGHLFPNDGEITRQVKETRYPVILADAFTDTRFQDFGTDQPIRGWMGVPLIVRGNVVGYITFDSLTPTAYTDSDAEMALAFASHAATAIENARLYQEALLAAERRSVLHQVSQEVARLSQDSEQLYAAIYQAALRLMPTDMFTIALVNQAEDQIDGAYAIDRGKRGPFISFPFNMGIAGRVIATNKTLLIDDYDDPSVTIERVQFSDNQPTRSILAVPLRSGEKVIGSMSVQCYQAGQYTEEDSVLLEMLGVQATVAIENARLFEQVRRRIKELEALNRASQSLSGGLDLEPLLENILHSAKDAITGAEKGTILLKDKDGDLLRVTTQIGYEDKRVMQLPFQPEKGYSGRAFREQRPILINDARAEYEIPFDKSVDEVNAVQSGIVVPLIVKDIAIGVITLDNASRKFAFTQNDLDILTIFASSAASVIENARLFEETRRRAQEFETLYGVTRDISSHQQDLSSLLPTLVERAVHLLGTHGGGMYLYDAARNDLEVAVVSEGGEGRGERMLLGEGAAGRVAETQTPLVIDDYQTWEGRRSILKDVPYRALLQVPMLYGGQLIGVLDVYEYGESERKYSDDDVKLLSLFSTHAASAIHNARLFEETRRRAEEFSSLYETARDIAAEQDLNSVLKIIVERAAILLNAPISGIYLFDRIRNDLYVAVSKGFENSIDTRLAMGEGVAGRVAQSRKPLIIDDHSSWEGRSQHYEKNNIRAVLEVPMLYGGELVGVLTVDEVGDSERKFTEDDARLLTLFASHAASAVHNARLLVETRRRSEEFEALYQTAANVSSHTDVKTVLNTIIERARSLSGASGAGLYLLDPERGDLELVAIIDPDIRTGIRLALGEGLSGRVAQTKEPLIVNDYQTWENVSSHYKGIPITSVLGIPMLYSGELIGVLNVHNRTDINQAKSRLIFNEQDINLLSLFANAAAGAVYNARLLDQTRRRLGELTAFAQVSSALRTASTRSEMMSVLLEQLMNVLHADGGNLISNIPGRDDLLIEAGSGEDARYAGKFVPSGEGLSRRVFDSGEPFVLADARSDPSFFNPGEDDKVYSIALVPLKSQDSTIGVISMGRAEKDGIMPAPFSNDDIRLLTAIADMAANAFQRASLHEETTRYAEQLMTINDLGHSLSETLELPRIYENLCRAALDLLPDTASVFVSISDSNERSIKAVYGIHAGIVVSETNLPTIPFDESGYGNQSQVILNGEALIVPDLNVSINKEKEAILIKSGNEEQSTQSALYVPMKAEGRVIGVLNVQSFDKNHYTSADAELLELVANTAAAAIQNARLFTQLTRRVDQLSALHSVDTTISSTTDLRVSLQSVLENVTRQLKVDAADVLLLNPVTLILQYVAGLGFFTSKITHTSLPLGKGQAGKAALERRIVRIPDLTDRNVKFSNNSMVTGERFAAYLAVPLMAKGEVKGVLEIFQRSSLELDDDWMSFLEMLAGQAALAIDNALLFEGLEKVNIELTMAYDATIEGWSQALELRDQETQGHSVRVLDLTLSLAAGMGVSSKDLQDIRRGVLLHDIGKMGIPDAILHKPDKLTDEEWEIMRKHPKYAYDMLAPITYLRNSLDIPYCHHEKWDGSGYPRGLSGEAIPLAARIFCIVDVYDALTSNRPYREAWSKEKTLEYIREQSGTHFDPRLVDIFLKFIQE